MIRHLNLTYDEAPAFRRWSDKFVQSNLTSWARSHWHKSAKCLSFKRTDCGIEATYEVTQ